MAMVCAGPTAARAAMPAAKRGQRVGSVRGNVKVMAIKMGKHENLGKSRCVDTMETSFGYHMIASVFLCGSEQEKKQKVHNDMLPNLIDFVNLRLETDQLP